VRDENGKDGKHCRTRRSLC